MSKHTPGPWFVDDVEKYVSEVRAGETTIAVDVEHYDARLIAAAPEMLDALKRVAASAGVLDGGDRVMNAVCAAIAKAEGRE